MIQHLWILAAVLTIGGSTWAQTITVTGGAEALLDRPITNLEIRDIPATDALEWLADSAGLGLIVNWERLAELGYDPDRHVSISLRGVSLRVVLRLVLAEIFDNSEDIVVEVAPEYLRIVTRDQADSTPVVKVYTLGEVLHHAPDFEGPELDLGTTADSGAPFSAGTDEEDQLTAQERGEQFAQLIRSTIEPDIWQENGGTLGRITYYQGRLIILAPEYVHQKIGLGDSLTPVASSAATVSSISPVTTEVGTLGPSRPVVAPLRSTWSRTATPSRYRQWSYSPNATVGSSAIAGIDWTAGK